ncbi:MAG: nuclear transport factor 2 family protein [Actinomycetota bacterium]|nr:nuclear transport factor 2 family protein [Acidimicrobiia bacterium]MDQ3145464.1 nuclear transport factor 2 family protein [Actinomycetota bacterium]
MAEHPFPREEVEAAFAEFVRLGAKGRDWPAWAALFTEDALYVEHSLGTFHGRQGVHDWIVPTMAPMGAMTFSIDWTIFEEDRVAFYIWNHLPDPAGGAARYGFPNLSVLVYAGDGRFSCEEDFYNPADAERVVGDWYRAGGRADTPADPTLTAISDHTPDPVAKAFPRPEVERELAAYVERGARAKASGDWGPWAGQFTPDARYWEHHYGRFRGRAEIRSWITGVMQPFPDMDFPVDWSMIDGNRAVLRCQNRLPDPAGGEEDFAFAVGVILHYAGEGQWSYEEDCYNPAEVLPVVERWVAAGGKLPDGLTPAG